VTFRIAAWGALAQRVRDGWAILVVVGGALGVLAMARNSFDRMASLPSAVDSLRMQHDTQIDIARDQREYLRKLVCIDEYPRGPDREDCLINRQTGGVR
jgi:hypothetical protein